MVRIFVLLTIFFSILALIGCSGSLTEEQMLEKAIKLEEKEKWKDTADMYEKMVKKFPESEKAAEHLYKLGVIYANNLGDLYKSINSYSRLIKRYPESNYTVQATFMMGYRYANDIKDLRRAKRVYTHFIEKYPDHELTPSVKWELKHLGKDISEIELELGITKGDKTSESKAESD
jgi:TolA-binding protein